MFFLRDVTRQSEFPSVVARDVSAQNRRFCPANVHVLREIHTFCVHLRADESGVLADTKLILSPFTLKTYTPTFRLRSRENY